MRMKWKSGIILAVILSASWAAPKPFAVEDPLRLPGNSKPTHYDLALRLPNVDRGLTSFDGTVAIEIEVLEATNTLTLHNRGLVIQDVKLLDSIATDIYDSKISEAEKEFVHFQATRLLTVGENVTLEVTFSGELRSDLTGLYRSSYKLNDTTIR